MIVKSMNKILQRIGYSITKYSSSIPIDLRGEAEFLTFYDICKPYTQTSIERLFSLYKSCIYVIENKLEGDLVECGVWKGGSAMMIAKTFLSRGVIDKTIYLYDTFEGMSSPTEHDISINGKLAKQQLLEEDKLNDSSIWCYAPFEEVANNMNLIGYPANRIKLVKGKVEDTLPITKPERVALLRLDTDWYESTKIELELLYPLLVNGGPLIIDDFGHWEGAKKAVIEYFQVNGLFPLLQRIDITGRLHIKI